MTWIKRWVNKLITEALLWDEWDQWRQRYGK